jgi:transposase
VKEILQDSFQLRDRRERNPIGEQELAIAGDQLEARLDRTLNRNYRSSANRLFANHLRRERNAMFLFLYCPGLDATNYRAEQAIRPMVVTRKVWGGNRTEQGAHLRACGQYPTDLVVSNSGQRPRSWSNCSICPSPKPWS